MSRRRQVSGPSPLIPLYTRWMQDFLRGELPTEPLSTCHDCPMSPHSGACGNEIIFRANTKCCSFWPVLPNYLVGSVLTDNSPDTAVGRMQFEKAAQRMAIVNPLGIFPSRDYSMTYRWSYSNLVQRESLLCPYYLQEAGGLCGIWRHRNGRCSTWFCKHERGSTGLAFWSALDVFLEALETTLSRWCIARMAAFPASHSSEHPAPADGSAWGGWTGREREFFIACWREVEPLSWPEAVALTGPGERVLAGNVREAFTLLRQRSVPKRLKLGDVKVEPIDSQRFRVWAYSVFDWLDLDAKVLDVLTLCAGEPAEQILKRLEAEKGIRMDEQALQKLIDFKVLVPA